MTADPYQQPQRTLDWIRETTEQLGDRPALADPLARDYDSQTTQGSAPD